MINTPGTDTPGIYESDLPVLHWAALFAEGLHGDSAWRAALLGDHAPDNPANEYSALAGLAGVYTGELLRIVRRLAAQAEKDAATIARQQAELVDAAREAGTLRGKVTAAEAAKTADAFSRYAAEQAGMLA